MRCAQCTSMIGPTDPRCPACGAEIVLQSPLVSPSGPVGPGAPASPVAPAAPQDPWAVPPPGAEWGLPQHLNQPGDQTPAQPYGYPVQAQRDAGVGYSVAAIVFGAVALVFCPLVLGIVALLLSKKAKTRGESLAGVARTVSIIGLVGGLIIGVLVNLVL